MTSVTTQLFHERRAFHRSFFSTVTNQSPRQWASECRKGPLRLLLSTGVKIWWTNWSKSTVREIACLLVVFAMSFGDILETGLLGVDADRHVASMVDDYFNCGSGTVPGMALCSHTLFRANVPPMLRCKRGHVWAWRYVWRAQIWQACLSIVCI